MLVIFDLDNTIYDFVSAYGGSLRVLSDDIEDTLSSDKENGLSVLSQIFQRYNTVEFWPDKISAKKHVDYKSWRKLRQDFREELISRLETYEEIHKTIYLLKELGVTVVAATNAPFGSALAKLHIAGLTGYFDKIIAWDGAWSGRYSHRIWTEDDVGFYKLYNDNQKILIKVKNYHLKPSPYMYQLLMNLYNTDPRDVWVIGDSQQRDLIPSTFLKIQAIYASYGCDFSNENASLLDKVTPWAKQKQLEFSFPTKHKIIKEPKMILDHITI